MSETSTSTRVFLEERFDLLTQQYADLLKQGDQIRSEMDDIAKALAALGIERELPLSVGAARSDEWAGFRRAIDAIEAYIDRYGPVVDQNEMAARLKSGGFGSKTKRPLFNVLDSVRYHSGTGGRLIVDGQMVSRAKPD